MKYQSRRSFLGALAAIALGGLHSWAFAATQSQAFHGAKELDQILSKARAEKWDRLPIGEVMGRIALALEGTPYKSGTLDVSVDTEVCTVNLSGLDCVTFVETCLDLARVLKRGNPSVDALLNEVRFTRYRGGKQGDYTSRLHYTSDWLLDNERKGVLQLLSKLPGSEPFQPAVDFMSAHPQSYPQLASAPSLLGKLKSQEAALNKNQLMFVPAEKIAQVESLLQTGDIVGLCSRVPGLDIEHVGLVIRKDGVARFMDASSAKSRMKVTLESGALHQAITRSNKNPGAVFARPLPVAKL
jgi:hypothetical protein